MTPGSAEPRVTLITRVNCHLCDEAWLQLVAAQQLYGFTLRRQDVDTDPALVAEHGECVPVVVVNGKVRFRGKVNAVLLEKLLEGR